MRNLPTLRSHIFQNQDISDIFNQVEERERREFGQGEGPGEGPKWAQAAGENQDPDRKGGTSNTNIDDG